MKKALKILGFSVYMLGFVLLAVWIDRRIPELWYKPFVDTLVLIVGYGTLLTASIMHSDNQ